jgi:hypothetical protein
LKVVENLKVPQPSKSERKVDEALLKTVEKAVYGCVLGAFVQGLEVRWSPRPGISQDADGKDHCESFQGAKVERQAV